MRVWAWAVLAWVLSTAVVSAQPPQPTPPSSAEDHGEHHPTASDQAAPAGVVLPPFIPRPTDADRASAFPKVAPHVTHDEHVFGRVLFDQMEWQAGGRTEDGSVDTTTWIGTDLNRLWIKAEGDRARGRFEQAQVQALYGRAISRWWQVVAGVRQDIRPGAPRTALALGVQGLAPYWVHVDATFFLEPNGRAHLRAEAEHDLLITNRLVLQPLAEIEIYSRADPAQLLGRGLATLDAGLRLRYEVRREIAPYVGIVWHRRFFDTATQARAAGRQVPGLALAVGLRWWR